jgi:hypothetical protein
MKQEQTRFFMNKYKHRFTAFVNIKIAALPGPSAGAEGGLEP